MELVLTFKGRGDFSFAALIAAMLLRARSLKGALASHSSREIWGFGCDVGVGGAAGRRCAFDRTADIVPQRYEKFKSGGLDRHSSRSPLASKQSNQLESSDMDSSIQVFLACYNYQHVLIVELRGCVYQVRDNSHNHRRDSIKSLRRYIFPWRWLIRH